MDIFNAVEEHIANNKFEKVFQIMLRQDSISKNTRQHIIQFQSRYNNYKQDILKGLKDDKIELSKIRTGLLEINSEYFESRKTFSDDEQVYFEPKNSFVRYIIYLILFLLLLVVIYQYQTNQSLKNELHELKLSIEMNKTILTSEVNLDSFVTIWDKSVMIQAKEHYSKVKLNFKGIISLGANPDSLTEDNTAITADVGDVFYLKRSNHLKDIWGVNVVARKENQVALELFPKKN